MAKSTRANSLRRAERGREMSVPRIVHTADGTVEIPRDVLSRSGIGPGDAVLVYQLGEEIRIERYAGAEAPSSPSR